MKSTPTSPTNRNYFEAAPGIWSLNEAMQLTKASAWPTQGVVIASQVEFTTAGTYSWVAPIGTTSVSVVCIGAGGSNAGGGGELRYKNNISVTPGTSYEVVVAAPGNFWQGGAGNYATVSDGGFSQFINGSTCKANGGRSYYNTSNNGGQGGVGDGGGNGGTCPDGNYFGYGVGGAGAGGYSGTGGNGSNGSSGNAGSGGAGGGGIVMTGALNAYGRGGGCGLYGQGTSGAAGLNNPFPPYGTGPANNVGQGGDGSLDVGSGTYTNRAGMRLGYGQGYSGATGGVRIVWSGTTGITRTFPSTNVLDL